MQKRHDISQPISNPAVTSIYTKEVERPKLPKGIKLDENIYVQMRDGIKLAVDIYRPESQGRFPAILSMAPYLKEIQQNHPALSHSIEAGATGFFVPKGYVHVICQIRGSGFSQGQWAMLDPKEQQDGYDMVEWIAQQPWCNGNVGMIGDSYWAWTQYLVAAQKPPHLKCIAPHDGGTDVYRDVFYQGGVFNAGEFANHWVTDTIFQCIWPGPVKGKLPPINLFADLASHPEDGPYYWERSSFTKIDQIEVPVLDCVALTVLHSRGQLAAYPKIKAVKKLIIEPEAAWGAHLRFVTNRPLNEQVLRWLDYWLKGIDTGIMDEPEVAIFDNSTQEWRYENEYPLKRTEWKKFYFHTDPGHQATEPPYGSISLAAPNTEEPDRYMVPESSGKLAVGEPVLAYETPPLDKDIRVWGPISTTIYGSSSSVDTIWFIKLTDIGPSNEVRPLSRGILRAAYKEIDKAKSTPGQPFHSFQKPIPLIPGKVYEFQIEMRPIFYTFKAGHKIRIEIASDDITYFGTLNNLDTVRIQMPAENAVYHDAIHASYLLLPVIPDAPMVREVKPPLSDINWPVMERFSELRYRSLVTTSLLTDMKADTSKHEGKT